MCFRMSTPCYDVEPEATHHVVPVATVGQLLRQAGGLGPRDAEFLLQQAALHDGGVSLTVQLRRLHGTVTPISFEMLRMSRRT